MKTGTYEYLAYYWQLENIEVDIVWMISYNAIAEGDGLDGKMVVEPRHISWTHHPNLKSWIFQKNQVLL